MGVQHLSPTYPSLSDTLQSVVDSLLEVTQTNQQLIPRIKENEKERQERKWFYQNEDEMRQTSKSSFYTNWHRTEKGTSLPWIWVKRILPFLSLSSNVTLPYEGRIDEYHGVYHVKKRKKQKTILKIATRFGEKKWERIMRWWKVRDYGAKTIVWSHSLQIFCNHCLCGITFEKKDREGNNIERKTWTEGWKGMNEKWYWNNL